MFAGKASPRPKGLPARLGEREFQILLGNTARFSLVFIGLVVLVSAMMAGKGLLMPVSLAIIVGLMFGPVADRLERRGIPPGISAAIVVFGFIGLILASIAAFAVPLSEWGARGPLIWEKIKTTIADLREPLAALSGLQDQFKTVLGGSSAVEVAVADGNPVTDIAFIAPAILGEILVFLVSLYFYLATRDGIRMSVLSLVVSRKLRWRAAHVFRDVESKVSRFLLSITFLNIGVGVVMTIVTWWLGLPSPLLWGALAFFLNYIPYVGPAVMIAILLAVGLATQTGWVAILAPSAFYLLLNFVEGQVVFPALVGRLVSLNPFLVFLSILFWIWAWGPFGALMAVPSLLIAQSLLSHILPGPVLEPSRPVRRTTRMTERDVVLANAAAAIRERAEAEAAEAAAAEEKEKAEKAEKAAAKAAAEPKTSEPESAPVLEAEPVAAKPKPRRRATKAKPATA
jgi:predicted PurR-regulated permease PerM